MQAGQAAPQRPSLAQTAMNPLARAYQLYQQYVGEPFQQAVRGGVRGYFGLPMMTDASSVSREAYRQGEALGFTPGVGMPAGAVRVAAEGMQALPSIAGDIGRVISGLPSGAAARQAEDFAAYQRSIPPSDVSPLTAFHGTPHTFAAEPGFPLGRFRSEKIGTGEGAQAYGYGLYFAQSPGVAKSYQTNVGDYSVTKVEGVEQINDPDFGDALVLEPTEKPEKTLFGKEAIDFLRKHIGKPQNNQNKLALNWLDVFEREGYSIEVPGRDKSSLYTVDIPDAMVDKMLDWDKPLSQQPEVLKAIDRRYDPDVWLEQIGVSKNATGGDLLQALGATRDSQRSAAVSSLLRDFGIPGIRYLDQSSRVGGEGTRNIVVFPGEESKVKILKRE
jgi:hypothetical protein